MKSMFMKHFVVNALLILVSFIVLGTGFIWFSYQYLTSEREEQLSKTAELISRSGINDEILIIDMEYRILLYIVGQVSDSKIVMCGPDGKVLACSENITCEHIGWQMPGEVMEEAGHGGYTALGTLGGMYEGQHQTVGVPILSKSGAVRGAVFVSATASGLTELIASFIRIFLMISVLVLAAAYTSAYMASRRLTRPLGQMADVARSFARGDYGMRAPQNVHSQDEVTELAEAFNTMADSIEKTEELRSSFIANVSHELRTPMTTISGFMGGIIDGTIPVERRDEYLNVISEEVLRLSRLVRRLVDLTRLQSDMAELSIRPFDICEVIRRTLLGFEQTIEEKKLTVEADLPDDSVSVNADHDLITQVVFNLIENAVKFARDGSPLTIGVAPKSGKILVSVRNEGEVIPPDDLPYVFDRFHKADHSRAADREGLGLGLYLVKIILAQHKEDIDVTSAGGVTEFVFSLRHT